MMQEDLLLVSVRYNYGVVQCQGMSWVRVTLEHVQFQDGRKSKTRRFGSEFKEVKVRDKGKIDLIRIMKYEVFIYSGGGPLSEQKDKSKDVQVQSVNIVPKWYFRVTSLQVSHALTTTEVDDVRPRGRRRRNPGPKVVRRGLTTDSYLPCKGAGKDTLYTEEIYFQKK